MEENNLPKEVIKTTEELVDESSESNSNNDDELLKTCSEEIKTKADE